MSKTVLITGALGGIGHATAVLFHQLGWHVCGLDFPSPYPGDPVHADAARFLALTSSDSLFTKMYYCDLGINQSELDIFFRTVLSELPRLDSLVHCAALQTCGTPEQLQSKWDEVMNVNVRSIFQLSQLAFPTLLKSHGNVVIVSSVHAFQSSRNIASYAISKCALTGVIRNLAIEWASAGVRVNGVAPGATDTAMLRAGLARSNLPLDQSMTQLANRHLIGRILKPEEIAQTIAFLAQNELSSAITGQTIIADGGATILLSTEVN